MPELFAYPSNTVARIAALRHELDDDWGISVPERTSDQTPKAHPLVGTSISLRGLHKSYAGRGVIKSLNLDIAPGEFVAVIGRSGCGKSTLLRLLAGLEDADAGELKRGTQATPVAQIKTTARQDGGTRVMFQDARLLPWKSVLDNVRLGLPGDRNHTRKVAEAALKKVDLADRATEWPAVLSGGQRQRVALARALVHQPSLLLLDEPLGALDALTRIEMQSLIEQLWLEQGFTALLVTHDVQEAIALADRVILIEDGQVSLDLKINLPRPRARGDALFAELEDHVLKRVLRRPSPVDETTTDTDVSPLATFNPLAWAV
ncbi:ATP-binding cassette domain-containing protein [Undibacterium sp. SXout20W]|uniref:ATP-binding cassette domain-containing protein n=1 Tax=Undibacterium sp. SXout20W TaxID=3413051 RepID=UPI003BF00CDD